MLRSIVELARPSHWTKNVFVLAPLVFAELLTDPRAVLRALAAVACFCAAASAIYAFNDLKDRNEDRNHPLKRNRPVASGRIGPGVAATIAVVLALAAAAGGLALGPQFLSILLCYLVLNSLYSIHLKHVVILDVMIVAAGFVLRVAAGAAAIPVGLSAWLLLCTIFIALFLAFSKRRHELLLMEGEAQTQRRVLEQYSTPFLDQMINVVTASTVVSYALYSASPAVVERFGYRFLAATIPFVLFGIFRYLYLTYQKPDRRNPTEAVLRDLPSLANVALWGAAVLLILYASWR